MGKTDLSIYTSRDYKETLPNPLVRTLWFVVNIIVFRNPFFVFYGLKCFLIRVFKGKVGKSVIFKPSVNIKYPWNLQIDDHVWIGEHVWIDSLAPVIIGRNVCVSQGAMLLTGNHNFSKSSFDLIVKGITLEDGCWVGAKSVVCPGVVCRSHSVLTVMSVATKDLEPYTVYSGNPASPQKKRVIVAE